ncbi:MAG: GntR family transcriptional regulator [Propionibacterium sp.]|nr:GntR family transcriptional regulator [Propionibacterium sp.]
MPKHEWIRSQLLAEVAGLPTDTRLPDERELTERFGVSRATVRQALAALVNEQKIYSIRGHGTFVAGEPISRGLRLRSFSEDMRERGLEPSTRLLLAEEVDAAAEVAARLELAPGTTVVHLERLRLADGFPMCLETIWLPTSLFPRLLTEDLHQSLYSILSNRYQVDIDSADEKIESAIMDRRTRELLSMPNPSSALIVIRRSFDKKGRAVEYGRSAYRADRYSFDVSIKR